MNTTNKIDFKSTSPVEVEKDKLYFKLFVQILLSRFTAACRQSSAQQLISGYMLTSELNKNINVKNFDIKALFDKYLVQLRTIMRGAN